ncbi:MAG: hypothetical protein ABIN36_17210 [Ferruginibacter sp.]
MSKIFATKAQRQEGAQRNMLSDSLSLRVLVAKKWKATKAQRQEGAQRNKLSDS